MKKFVDYIMAPTSMESRSLWSRNPQWIFNPEIILPPSFWRYRICMVFYKKKPNATKRNIAAIASILAVGGTYLINPNIASTKQEEQARYSLASTPSKKRRMRKRG